RLPPAPAPLLLRYTTLFRSLSLHRMSDSEGSVLTYCRTVDMFLRFTRKGPQELVQLPRKKAEAMVRQFGDWIYGQQRRSGYANTDRKSIRVNSSHVSLSCAV